MHTFEANLTLHLNIYVKGAPQLNLKAVLFDLHGTLVYVRNPVTHQEASNFLVSRGYEVYPQTYMAAWRFVAFIDYPKHGYKDYHSFLKRLLWRIKVKVDKEILDGLSKLYQRNQFELYPDALEAMKKTKEHSLKTAIVTTIARFKFQKALQPILPYLDTVVTGYEARCEKSNPRMFKQTLEILNVRPSEAVMIGDDVPIDILIPKKLGVHTILLDRKRKISGNEFPDAVVDNLVEAIKTIEAWIRR
jgi:HAD superfamily hydrolase (TIGR01549 family)